MTRNLQVRTSIIAVLIAGFLLSNPVTAFVDLLPNCIGYWLLCFALRRFADLNGRIFEAVRRFRILSVLSIVQLLAMAFAYGIIDRQAANVYEMRSFLMLGAFLMTLAQWLLLLPAIRYLFYGLDSLAQRYNASLLTCQKRGRTLISLMAKKTRIFVILSSLMALLPELSAFSSLDGKGENGTPPFNIEWYSSVLISPSQAVDRYGYIHVIRVLCVAIALIAAVIWIISFVRFLLKLCRDREWLACLDARYRMEILPQTGMFTVRRFSTFFYLLQIAILFFAGLRLNFYEALPGAILALLAFVACWTVRKQIAISPTVYVACILCGIVSVAQIALNAFYLTRFEPQASLFQGDAYDLYLIVRSLDVAEAVFSLIMVAVLLGLLYAVARTHTGVRYGDANDDAFSQRSAQRLHQRFASRLKTIAIFFVLSTAARLLEIVFRLQYPWLWLPAFVLAFVGIMLFYSVIYELKSEISFFYESDGMNKNI